MGNIDMTEVFRGDYEKNIEHLDQTAYGIALAEYSHRPLSVYRDQTYDLGAIE